MSITITEQREQNVDLPLHAAAPALARPFSLGDWRVLPQLNRLQHLISGEERQLEPRLIKLLCFLAANEHRVLSREELVQELWPRVIVNENSLTRAISELRKQLQSTIAVHANYIETIPKRGYRLIPMVEFTEARRSAAMPGNFSLVERTTHTATSKVCCRSIGRRSVFDTGWMANYRRSKPRRSGSRPGSVE